MKWIAMTCLQCSASKRGGRTIEVSRWCGTLAANLSDAKLKTHFPTCAQIRQNFYAAVISPVRTTATAEHMYVLASKKNKCFIYANDYSCACG